MFQEVVKFLVKREVILYPTNYNETLNIFLKKLKILSMKGGNLVNPPKSFTVTDELYIIDFINQFERYTKFYSFNTVRTALFFPLCIDDFALQYYETLSTEIQLSYDATSAASLKWFQ